MSNLKSYHFDLGNSSVGPIGFCARIIATSKKRALELLKQALPEAEKIYPYGEEGVEYIEVYFNDAAISVKDIDEWEFVEEAED